MRHRENHFSHWRLNHLAGVIGQIDYNALLCSCCWVEAKPYSLLSFPISSSGLHGTEQGWFENIELCYPPPHMRWSFNRDDLLRRHSGLCSVRWCTKDDRPVDVCTSAALRHFLLGYDCAQCMALTGRTWTVCKRVEKKQNQTSRQTQAGIGPCAQGGTCAKQEQAQGATPG